jgi:hypothetical protein
LQLGFSGFALALYLQCPSRTSPAAVSAAVGAYTANARSHQGHRFFTL